MFYDFQLIDTPFTINLLNFLPLISTSSHNQNIQLEKQNAAEFIQFDANEF